ncbi:hypothetical protein TrLO_g4875 [Triparma laevis f. longispina]|uniref:Uncharacterized protein n=1 Tax=Triparma laevis f. longispina TaxID=1714387 RepID=A0A9W7E4G1_9STRA|nr:hypothetical protein TrLO_g4875 [Triparma laevis f. longispina]
MPPLPPLLATSLRQLHPFLSLLGPTPSTLIVTLPPNTTIITTSFHTLLSTLTNLPLGNHGVSELNITLNLLNEVRVIKLDGSARFIVYLGTTLEYLTGFGKLRQQSVARFLRVVKKEVLPEFYGCAEVQDGVDSEDIIINCLGNQLKKDTEFVAGLVKEYCEGMGDGGDGGGGEADIFLLAGASLSSSRVTEQGEMWLSGCRLRNDDDDKMKKKKSDNETGFNFVCMFSDPFVPTLNNISISTPLDGLNYDKISSSETLASMDFASKLKSLGVDVVVCTFGLSPSFINALRSKGLMYVSNLEESELEKLAWKSGVEFYEGGERVYRVENVVSVKGEKGLSNLNCSGRIVKDRRKLGRGVKGELRGDEDDDEDY